MAETKAPDAQTETIPLAEEEVRFGKREVEAGGVRVRTTTETVDTVARGTLRDETLSVERVPVGRTLREGEAVPAVRTEGDVTVVPVLEETLVVEKRLVLKEEVRIRRSAQERPVEVPVSLRRQNALVENIEGETTSGYSREQK